MKILRPIVDRKSWFRPISQAIFKHWDETIFAPLLATLKQNEILNAKETALVDALQRGVLEYRDGYFYGNLRADVSREIQRLGGKYNKTFKAYALEVSKLPQEALQAIATSRQSNQSTMAEIDRLLTIMAVQEVKIPELGVFFGDNLKKLDQQFHVTTKAVTSADLEIPINPKFEDQLREAYTDNLEKYIKGWQQEAILRLREKVSQNVHEGYRASNLIDIIKAERNVSQRKAEFLARQETGLVTAAYREIRYKDIGVTSYVWSTSHDERVREDHRILNGHVFQFDHPPVTNQKTGARNNPSEDFNCRCTAIPILKGVNFYDEEPISTAKLMESKNAK